ncbi:glycine/betaine ABC transporter substrate-binding protein [Intrasporangium oryzae NRRL B-24470]|uniref:Glycine/betaine ABC transporter substrate-binding protein n=1 Tax=Intrasporangium oryzae NRRL B-24470 TaxID=1386089 RepID=W9G5I7_9MICO|nr:ABC transporter substrate-binding protein [Intrasporangium oryzae]EWT01431.1 glycine/betaine ABC transporter substrate-binding protein [Intrasporangium oryzae NRRL B-24470]
MTRTRILGVGLLLAAVVPLAACGSSTNPLTPATSAASESSTGGASSTSVTVGSADFPEAALLGEVYAQALEAKGITVKRQFNIGSRETYLKAITGGEIDVIAEYTGSLLNYLDKSASVSKPDEVYAALQKAVPQGLTVLDKSAAEDKNSLAVTKETATAWSLKAIPDLAAHQSELTIAAPPEFKTRQQGLVGLKSVYNITPAEFRPLQSQATVDALKNGQVKAANIFSTDPSIAANGFVVLEDPKSLFGSDNVVPLVRQEKADSVKAALNAVSAKLDTPALADMVKQVVVDKKDANVVAKAWLTSAGLL